MSRASSGFLDARRGLPSPGTASSNPFQAATASGLTLLHVAANHDNEAAVAVLLARGARPQAEDASKRTPLDLAVAHARAVLREARHASARVETQSSGAPRVSRTPFRCPARVEDAHYP